MRSMASRPCEDPVTSCITPRDEGAAAEQRRLHDHSGASDLNDCNSPVDHHLDCQPGVSSTGSEQDQTWHKEAHQVSKAIDVFLRCFSPKLSAGFASLGFPVAASSQTPQLTRWCARSSSPTVTVKYFNQCLTLLAWPPPQECGGVRWRLQACAVAATAAFGTSGGSYVGVAQQLRIYQSLLGPGGPFFAVTSADNDGDKDNDKPQFLVFVATEAATAAVATTSTAAANNPGVRVKQQRDIDSPSPFPSPAMHVDNSKPLRTKVAARGTLILEPVRQLV
ncbi:hypothetical protein DFJ73DRAFT_860803 [Zopfochytrium polystomum]|nr:hypothetical protein DFJ73DRAFT_860803 [Zopfochytrium polystomum]